VKPTAVRDSWPWLNITCTSARQVHLAPAVVSRGTCRADALLPRARPAAAYCDVLGAPGDSVP